MVVPDESASATAAAVLVEEAKRAPAKNTAALRSMPDDALLAFLETWVKSSDFVAYEKGENAASAPGATPFMPSAAQARAKATVETAIAEVDRRKNGKPSDAIVGCLDAMERRVSDAVSRETELQAQLAAASEVVDGLQEKANSTREKTPGHDVHSWWKDGCEDLSAKRTRELGDKFHERFHDVKLQVKKLRAAAEKSARDNVPCAMEKAEKDAWEKLTVAVTDGKTDAFGVCRTAMYAFKFGWPVAVAFNGEPIVSSEEESKKLKDAKKQVAEEQEKREKANAAKSRMRRRVECGEVHCERSCRDGVSREDERSFDSPSEVGRLRESVSGL